MSAGATPGVSVTSHASPAGDWRLWRRPPAPALRQFVAPYQGYEERTPGVARRRHLPAALIPLIVNLGPNLRLLDPQRPDAPAAAPDAFVAGVHDRFALSESPGESRGLQVDFTPVGARLFLGVRMDALYGRTAALDAVAGRAGRELVERLRELGGWDERFALLDAAIADRLARARPVSPGVAWAWARLAATHGRVEVATLAGALGWSRKHLAAQFRDQIGAPPKLVARVLRFRRARTLLDAAPPGSQALVASAAGYYDQAHFIRDFRQFAGCAPGEYIARRLPGSGGVDGA